MAQVVGELEIRMFAELARLQKDMNKVKGMVGGSMKAVESSVNAAKSVLASLGIGLGVGYFVSLIKGSINAADHLNDLSKTTKISVENLAGLEVVAKQSGTDLDGLAASINKLSQNMGKNAEKFAALGISAKDPLEAFKQLSDVFVSLEDPQQRAAVMAEILGKSWAGAAPSLALGGKQIGEMVEAGSRLSGITTEMAENADRFNDRMVALSTQLKSVALPAFLAIEKAVRSIFGSEDLDILMAQRAKAAVQYTNLIQSGLSKSGWAIDLLKTIDELDEKIIKANKSMLAGQSQDVAPKVDAAAKSAAAAKAAKFLSDPNKLLSDLEKAAAKIAAFNKLMSDLENATAMSQMNIITDEKEKSAMRIEIAKAEMLAKVDFAKLTDDQKRRYMDAFEKYSTAKTAEEVKKSQGAALDLIDAWQNTTKQLQDASAKWLQGTADALTDFVMTGKADFKSLADSIIRDIVRIIIQQKVMGTLSTGTSAGTGLLGLIGGIFGFADGGMHQGGARIVGENGPELEVTGPSRIYSSEQTKKMMGGGDTYNIDARGADRQGLGRLESMIRKLDGSIERRSVSAVANDRARGGVTA